jgi:nitroimidazol reductase NimA-like FMN-containing flavoprotein (pyridoxamine 5'-phosphate oxidase superfamily)
VNRWKILIGFVLGSVSAAVAARAHCSVKSYVRARVSLFSNEEGDSMMKMLSHDEALKLFQTAKIARLGCVVNGEPYVVPINFDVEDDCLYSHSLPGLKISGLRENPRACIQVDDIESDLHWRSAIAFGKYEEITKPNERATVLSKLLTRFPQLTPVESSIALDGASVEVIVFKIGIDRLTGVAEM